MFYILKEARRYLPHGSGKRQGMVFAIIDPISKGELVDALDSGDFSQVFRRKSTSTRDAPYADLKELSTGMAKYVFSR